MTCSGHADGTGLAHCSACKIQGCPACLEQVNGLYFCATCLVERLEHIESDTAEKNAAVELRAGVLEARGRNRRNWIITGIASLLGSPAVFGAIISDPGIPVAIRPTAALLCSAGVIYLIWAALWGIPATWRWWRGLFRGVSMFIFSSPFGWLLLAVTFFTIPLYFGYIYGVFGGAIHEYRQNRRIARSEFANGSPQEAGS